MNDEPVFKNMDLEEFWLQGLLLAANERFFWPLGLALTVTFDRKKDMSIKDVTCLDVRQWEYTDGHRESIEIEEDIEVLERRQLFEEWVIRRVMLMPEAEREAALSAANL